MRTVEWNEETKGDICETLLALYDDPLSPTTVLRDLPQLFKDLVQELALLIDATAYCITKIVTRAPQSATRHIASLMENVGGVVPMLGAQYPSSLPAHMHAHVHIHIHMHIHTPTLTLKHIHIHLKIHTHTQIHAYTDTRIQICTHTHIHNHSVRPIIFIFIRRPIHIPKLIHIVILIFNAAAICFAIRSFIRACALPSIQLLACLGVGVCVWISRD